MASASKPSFRLGVLSDTHGALHPGIPKIFKGVDLILHAGDIGAQSVLIELEALAPVLAVRGNMDHAPWAGRLPHRQSVRAAGLRVHLVHDIAHLALPPSAGDPAVVVSGHTHRAHIETRNGVLYVNPGSAGAPRYGEKASVALLMVTGVAPAAQLILLDP